MMFYLTLRIQADLSENSENRIPANPMVAHLVLDKIALLEVYPCTWFIFRQTHVPSEEPSEGLFGLIPFTTVSKSHLLNT